MKRLLFNLICIVSALLPLQAEVTASLLTASPGAEIYELDGHTGLRLTDPERGLDIVANWGVFDFGAPNFVYRFVKGETDYICAAVPADLFISSYLKAGRSITEQKLNLTPAQAETLLNLTLENLRPQNRTYRYSYIYDNCATRPFQLIERAIGRNLIPDSIPSDLTFRDEMRNNHIDFPWYQFGIDLALGSGLDKEISTRDLAFSPMQLSHMLVQTPIVESTIIHGTATLQHQPTISWLTPMSVGLIVLLTTVLISLRNVRNRYLSRWFDTILYSLFGLCGCVLAFLVLVSSHSATSPNWLLLSINPLCLIAALLPWIKSAKKWLTCYHFVNFATLIAGAILWPLTGQVVNVAIILWLIADATRSATNIYVCLKR